MKEQAYNVDRDKDHKSLTTKAISLISRRSVTMNSLRGRLLASNIESNKEVRSLRILGLGHSIIVSALEKDVKELKESNNTTILCASLKSEIPSAVHAFLGSSLGDELHKVKNQLPVLLPKAVSDFATLVIQSTVRNALEKTLLLATQSSSQAQPSLKAAESLSEYELKIIIFDKMDKSRSYLTHDKHQALYDALFNSLSLDDAIASGQAGLEKVLRKKDHDDEDPSAGPDQGKKTKRCRTKDSKPSKKSSTSKESSKGKSPAKTSKFGKSVTAKEPVKELVFEMASDDIDQTNDDMANDADQPPDDSTQAKDKDPKKERLPWFNQMVYAAKDPLTFDELMATPIYFSKPDWNNPEGDHFPFDLTKSLPLKGRPGRLTVAAEYFFNNDLEFLKSSDPEKNYTTSITKTKAARYEIVRIEDMVLTLWSTIKYGYNKDAEKEIKHWGEKRQLLYRSQINKFSKHNVYSPQKILSVVSVKVKRLHGYGHLDEIVVKRVDRQLYKFKEGDFVDLHLNDIADMLLLAV
ncbi:hypothetical protein Tco_0948937 [Tanacetum coccineum]